MLRLLEGEKKTLDGYKKQGNAVPKRPARKSGAMLRNSCPRRHNDIRRGDGDKHRKD
jgi:hypothetical protein